MEPTASRATLHDNDVGTEVVPGVPHASDERSGVVEGRLAAIGKVRSVVGERDESIELAMQAVTTDGSLRPSISPSDVIVSARATRPVRVGPRGNPGRELTAGREPPHLPPFNEFRPPIKLSHRLRV